MHQHFIILFALCFLRFGCCDDPDFLAADKRTRGMKARMIDLSSSIKKRLFDEAEAVAKKEDPAEIMQYKSTQRAARVI